MSTTPTPNAEPTPTPTACPFCQSSKITTPNEKVDANTYWRCDACGQMWNVARQRTTNRNQFGGRWNNGY
jgi:transposase-like protein